MLYVHTQSDKRRMERALLQGGDEEEAEAAERAEQEAAEFERAKERLTLKHRCAVGPAIGRASMMMEVAMHACVRIL